eukprot:GILK01001428.1.p1 GENE.GILK01001428.1~~GILK01001428.1.p1  ORF type:complete len:616 (-),score=127.61 GILK01001428.1:38-1885(-)
MPPKKAKKKKKSKKELQAELERQQEELRKAEEEERKRREEEERRAEEENKRRQEEEHHRRSEEAARLEVEDKSLSQWHAERREQLKRLDTMLHREEEWKKYIACNPRPDPSIEKELTAYITSLTESEHKTLEETMHACQVTEEIVIDLLKVLAEARESADVAKTEWCFDYLKQLRDLVEYKLDAATADVLQHADEHTNSKNEVQTAAATEHLKLGVWANLATKGFRIKTIDFADLKVTTELPKPLALQILGVRCLFTQFDAVSFLHHCRDYPLGGVFRVELLTLPPQPKRVKGWVMRQITSLSSSIQKIPYPSTDSAASTSTHQPVRVSFHLPEHVLMIEEKPRVALWDSRNIRWSEDGVQEVKFDKSTRIVSLQAARLAPMAVVQDRYRDFPYAEWLLKPIGDRKARLTLQGRRFPVVFEILENGIQLISPAAGFEELKSIRGQVMAPGLLLQALFRTGINLLPDDRDADFLIDQNITLKDSEAEERAYLDISIILPVFTVASSKFNQSRNREKALFRIRETIDYTVKDDSEDAADWQSVLYHSNKCSFVSSNDKDDLCDESIPSGDETHAILEICLRDRCSPEAMSRIKETGNIRFQETVRRTLRMLRLLSFC